MSFARSKRFNENEEVTPGPGQYQNEWGCIGRDSIKYRINTTPRFPEECRRRICIGCACADVTNKTFSKNQFLMYTPPSYNVRNITFRKRRTNGFEFRRALRDLILFRKKNGPIIYPMMLCNQ
ncbi:uncharacterized protein LOC123310076 [Coccinella septempunctata]|uniref:uncharacterized protein LOC123310076 n=1 Tax=Coccinella septempunctata TaxID=41139 RepID=UPI001D07A41F|nr:uncharacterized protein LOC123310076 [Coccinella septempunctata]